MDKVSVIVPMYNAENHIEETLQSILSQTYQNFEIICIDDISNDNTIKIVEKLMENEDKIKLYQLEEKGGASIARNLGIKEATGNYIAFLDADDVWLEDKLENQIVFMKENNLAFTYTNFGFIDNYGNVLEKYRTSPKKITYKSLSYGNTIGCLTVMYDVSKVGLIQIEKINKRNDFALWLAVLKEVEAGYLLPKILSNYRFVEDSLSRKDGKLDLIKYHIKLHRDLEGRSLLKSLFFTMCNMVNTVTISKKYTKIRSKV